MSNRPLVMLGALLAVAGLAIFLFVFSQSGGSDAVAGSGAMGAAPQEDSLSYGWSILAGLTLAVGAACIMIGLKNWQRA
jgi:hypothetical protein